MFYVTYKEQKVDNEENELDKVHTTPHLQSNGKLRCLTKVFVPRLLFIILCRIFFH